MFIGVDRWSNGSRAFAPRNLILVLNSCPILGFVLQFCGEVFKGHFLSKN